MFKFKKSNHLKDVNLTIIYGAQKKEWNNVIYRFVDVIEGAAETGNIISGATTLSLTTLSIIVLVATLSINGIQHYDNQHNIS